MPSLVKCPKCKAVVASSARRCPQCGMVLSRFPKSAIALLILIVVLAVLAFLLLRWTSIVQALKTGW